MKGYCFKIAYVNLTAKKITFENFDESFAKMYLGGNGFLAKVLFERIPKGLDPFSPENIVGLAIGPANGTIVQTAGRTAVAAKSPMTNLFCDSYFGGNFGAEMKYAGLDALFITGKSDAPIFLKVTNSDIKICDASHLWGHDIIETEGMIAKDIGKEYKTVGIGQGGENLVRYACLIGGTRAAGRGGMGAVFGSKNLKAVTIVGDNDVEVANPDGLLEFWNKMNEWGEKARGLVTLGTPVLVNSINQIGGLGTRNWQDEYFPEAEAISGELYNEKFLSHITACFGCPIACSRVFSGSHVSEGPEYETLYSLGSCCGISNPDTIITADLLCDEYSLDTISCGVSIAFAMEAYEKGILTKKDTDGMDFRFGNDIALIEAIRKIAKREGFGNFLAEGSRRMAQKLGVNFNMDVRGLELAGHSPRALKSMALSYAVSPRGGSHHDGRPTGEYGMADKRTIEGKVALSLHSHDWTTIGDSLVICHLVERGFGFTLNENHVELMRHLTGWDITLEELTRIAERIINLERAFNVREGVRRKDDTLPHRIMHEEIPSGGSKGCIARPEELEKMKDDFYKMRGWDGDGVPTRETLKRLALDWVTF
jgi:aldehyde:ferredoxin oxidoreductase